MGQVRSVDRHIIYSNGANHFYKGRMLVPFKSATCNYLMVALSRDSLSQKFLIHRLVAIVFLGLDPHSELEVNHINGQRFDNRAENLEVVSHQANIDHSVATMLKNDYGEKSSNAKLTNQQVRDIREAHRRGIMQKDLANDYGVSKQTICDIVRHKKYFR